MAPFLLSTRTLVPDSAHLGSDRKQSEIHDENFIDSAHVDAANTQPLEIYMHYAALERAREDADTRPIPDSPWIVLFKTILGKKSSINHANFDGAEPVVISEYSEGQNVGTESYDEKKELGIDGSPDRSLTNDSDLNPTVTKEERDRAYRVLRVASWQAVFLLIVTDVLGLTGAPETFQELGLGPGILVFTCFYILAVFAGQIIWKLYLHMDSPRFPVTCYADLGERVFGKAVRHFFNILQSFQLLFNVALLIVGNGQTLVTMIEFKFCYVALNVFFAIIGLLGGQIRSLRNFAWFANVNLWLNLITMVITIVGIELYKPVAAQSYHKNLHAPVDVSGWVPSYTKGWYQQVSGVQLAVFVFGGAMIFPEFMAEMRRPRDFWKSMLIAQFFCYFVYMLFGIINYAKQGQYASILPNLNFANQALILVNNVISLTTVMVAAVLYGNIGVKVFYENVLRGYFNAPPIVSSKGRWIWSTTVSVYWAIAFVIGGVVPNLTALITLVGAAAILQFTYTFPPILLMGFWMQIDAMKADRPWSPGMAPGSNRVDTWRDKSRWVRGFKKYWYLKAFLFLMFTASWANCGIGIYAGIETAIGAYQGGYNTPFSCTAPNDPSVLNG